MVFSRKTPLIILIAGKARSGKSKIAEYLQCEFEKKGKKVIVSPYTKYLKGYIENILSQKIDEDNKPRDLLQEISSKIIKGELKKDNFFINRQIEDLEIYSYFADVILIPDVRFPNEISIIKEKFDNVVSIGVIRENYISTLTKKQEEDITEIALDNYNKYDLKIINKNKDNLKDIAKNIFTKLNERG